MQILKEKDTKSIVTKLQQDSPKVMQHFSDLANLAQQSDVIDAKTKSLILLGMAIQSRNNDCIVYHVGQAHKQGVTHQEVQDLMTLAAYMGGGPALMAAEAALKVYEQLS